VKIIHTTSTRNLTGNPPSVLPSSRKLPLFTLPYLTLAGEVTAEHLLLPYNAMCRQVLKQSCIPRVQGIWRESLQVYFLPAVSCLCSANNSAVDHLSTNYNHM